MSIDTGKRKGNSNELFFNSLSVFVVFPTKFVLFIHIKNETTHVAIFLVGLEQILSSTVQQTIYSLTQQLDWILY